MVELATNGRIASAVVPERLMHEADPVGQLLLDACLVGGVPLQDVLGGGFGQSDARLFFLQNLNRDGIGVVGLEHLLALVVELRELALGFFGLAVEEREHGLDVLPDQLADLFALLLSQRHGLPVSLDQIFCHLDRDSALVAAVLEALPAEAIEVAIQVSLAVPRYGEAVRLPTATAEDRALEVVRADTRLLLTLNAAGADCLHAVIETFADQGFVIAGVLDALERDDSNVVTIFEDAVDVRSREWLRGLVGSCERRDPTLYEIIAKHHLRPFPGGVAFEELGHKCGPCWVCEDCAHLAPVLVALPDVEVAKGSHAGCAASFGLLEHALARLGGEVPRVELSDRTHDAVEQHAAWRFIDVLSGRDKGGASSPDCQVDLDVVLSVPGEAINLVDDDVVNVMIAEVLQH